jgi:Tfp pilus assembly protein PilF
MADLDNAVALDPAYARGYANRAAVHERRGDLDRAVANYDQALKLDPALAEAQEGRGRVEAARAAPKKAQ